MNPSHQGVSPRSGTPLVAMAIAVALVAAHTSSGLAAENPYNYVPRSGTSVVRKDGDGNKFINQFFKWPTAWSLQRLHDPTIGIEVSTVFHCTTTCWVANCGDVKSWDTDLPHAYRDTTFGDNCEYPQPTVGSQNTTGLNVNHNYSVFIRPYTKQTVGAGEVVRVKYSLTHKEPLLCLPGPEWCMFDLHSTNVINWTQVTPSVEQWVWP